MTLDRRTLMRTGLLSTAAIPLATSSGCATLLDLLSGVVKTPQLSLRSFKVTKMTLSALSVSMVALLKNPNPFGFRLDGLDWLINLAGGDVAKGRTPGGLALKARGTSQTTLELDFNLAKTTAALIELFEKRSVPLGIEAVGHITAARHRFDVPARYETKLPMPSLPTFDVPRFALRSASLSGLRFSIEPLLRNTNGFDIDVDRFDLSVRLGGREVLKNKSIRDFKVAKGKSERVPFEFDVGLAEIGMTMAKLATNPRLPWEVEANFKSGLLALPFRQTGRITL